METVLCVCLFFVSGAPIKMRAMAVKGKDFLLERNFFPITIAYVREKFYLPENSNSL